MMAHRRVVLSAESRVVLSALLRRCWRTRRGTSGRTETSLLGPSPPPPPSPRALAQGESVSHCQSRLNVPNDHTGAVHRSSLSLSNIITRTAHSEALIVRGTGYDVDHAGAVRRSPTSGQRAAAGGGGGAPPLRRAVPPLIHFTPNSRTYQPHVFENGFNTNLKASV
jgi:hypothetical protein